MGAGAAIHALNSFLSRLAGPVARPLGLEQLPKNFPWIAYSALGFTLVHVVLAPAVSQWVAPVSYAKLQGRRAKNNWDIHVVSLVHALIIIVLASRALFLPALLADPIHGWDDAAELANAIAAGYFVWDTIDAIVNFTDLGFVLHGLACTIVYTLTFRPILEYFSCRFLFWEMSTPFLNIHWFLDKTGYTGGTFQLINGILLLSTFFFVRIVYGWYTSIKFWRIMFTSSSQIPTASWVIFLLGHAVLMTLNLIWLNKMIHALRKRFDTSHDPKQPLLTPSDGLPSHYSNTNPVDGAA
ncbi:DUF887-domain-containing protein [Trametopsis cervina]|nr:DUF887-domain-containing protein [Trametopsis cervina]